MNKCKICGKDTKNKVYCSEICQYSGYKVERVEKIECECLLCQSKFLSTQYKIDIGKSKYCSRICKDNHQKEIYLKDGNPVYGKKYSDEERKISSERITELWKDENFKTKVKLGFEKFVRDNGYFPGSDEESMIKKQLTNIERYGVSCILSLPKYQKIREEKCLELYGKTSLELCRDSNPKKNTGIEIKIGKLLINNNIKFETQFKIKYNCNVKFYDFYLPEYNLIIEADGDYWHGNPNKYNNDDLNEVQIKCKVNDLIKDKLAKENNYNLIRFWELDINKKNFKYVLFNKLKEYEKDKN
jgi:very-short-patch-repair endonuclease